MNTMQVEHIAIWVENIEQMREFYKTYFHAISGQKYINPKKKYTSYFLTFGKGKCRIELMHNPDIETYLSKGKLKGLAHLAISVGNPSKVDELTERLRIDGYTIESKPRTTGDGYYESVVLDPEGNLIELTE